MSNAFAFGKKAFTWTVVVATIAWAMSAAFIAIPLTAEAATVAGDLIVGTAKSTSGAGRPVYYYGADRKRWLFPSSQTYKSWFGLDFSTVKNVTEAELQAIPFGGNITAKAGSLVKFTGPDTNSYVVEKGGVRRQMSLADAATVYGANYATMTYSIPESFQANYTAGAVATSGFVPSAAAALGSTIAMDKGIAEAPTSPSGALAVSLASDNPGAAVLPGGATSVVVLKFNLTAGSAAQTVTGITVKSVGVGSANDISAVYLYDGSTRLTSGRTLASQTRQTEFAALNLPVAANSTRTLSLVVDINSLTAGTVATAGDTHAFQVISLGTTASVSGLPITGATNSIGSQGVSTVTLTRGSDPANPTIGQTNVAIGEFRLTAGVNDVEFRRAVVTVGGTVTVSDITNFGLYQGATKLASGVAVSDRVTFDLAGSPYALGQGTNRLFTVKADVSGRGSRTITTYIDSTYPSDLLVVDKLYGYGALTTFTSFSAIATAASTPAAGGSFVTTQGGRVTVAFNGPSASDVALGSQDVPFYKFSLTAGDQALDIREVELTLAEAGAQVLGVLSNGTTNYFTDIKIKDADTGAVVMGPVELSGADITTNTTAAASSAVWSNDLTQSWTLDAGKKRNLVVTADIATTEVTTNDITTRAFAFTLRAFPSGSIREISTNQNIATTDIVGGQSNVTGNTMTVRASSLTVQLASTPVSGTSVKGATGVQMVGLSFAAGSQSDVKITQIVMTGQGDDTGGTYTAAEFDDVVLTATLYDGDTPVSSSKSPSTAGVLTFDNMNWTIAAGATKKLVARVDLATTQMSSAADTAWLGIALAADITAQDKDSNTVTATDGDATWSGPINSTPTVVLTSAASGTLTVDVDGDTALSSIILGGASGVNMTKVKFLASSEDFRVKRLRVSNDSADDDTGVVQLKLTYPKQDGTLETKTGVLSSAAADFSDLNFYVPRDKTTVMTIAADFATISESGVSGDTPTLRLDFGGTFEAVGAASGSSLDEGSDVHGTGQTTACSDGGGASTCYTDTATITGNAMTLRKTKPTVTLSAASPSGASVPGLNEVLRFTVAADAAGDVVLDALTFNVTSTDNASTATGWNVEGDSSGVLDVTSSWSLYDSSDLTTPLETSDANWTLYATTGAAAASSGLKIGAARLVFGTARTIAAGTSKTYVLKVDTTGASSSADDTVRFDILEENGATDSSTLEGLAEFQWDEVGSGAATDILGTLVKNLPVIGGTIIY